MKNPVARPRSRSRSNAAPPPSTSSTLHGLNSTKRHIYCFETQFLAWSVFIVASISIFLLTLIFGDYGRSKKQPVVTDHLYHLGNLNFCEGEYCWPRIYLIGAAKSGTTSLWSVLRSRARGLCTPALVEGDPKWYRKEGTFFSVDSHFYPNNTPKLQSQKHYLQRYPINGCKLPSKDSFLDATPSYLSHPRASSRMKITYQHLYTHNIRFVAVLRNPIDRDLSWYRVGEGLQTDDWWERKLKTCGKNQIENAKCYDTSVDFEIEKWDRCMSEVLKAPCHYRNLTGTITSKNLKSTTGATCYEILSSVRSAQYLQDVYAKCHRRSRLSDGIYLPQVLNWMNDWGRDKLFIIKTAELLANSENHIRNIVQHLDLKINFTDWKGMPQENETSKKKKYLSFTPFCSTIRTLAAFYKPYNDMLLAVLRRTSSSAPPTEPFFRDIDPAEYPHCVVDGI